MVTISAKSKEAALITALMKYKNLAIAFSGGVDSTYLLALARECLVDGVVALTAQSPIHSNRERESAEKLALALGVRHILIKTSPLSLPDFTANTAKRCYYCKKHLFETLWEESHKLGFSTLAHGANLDDASDYRPGSKAAEQLKVKAPLAEVGMTKEDIRFLSRRRGLLTWDKPAMACLATRIPYGQPITLNLLEMINDAEDLLYGLGFWGCRVRWHDKIARIEAPVELMPKFLDPRVRPAVLDGMQRIGFEFVTMDLKGYVQGSMNRLLT